MSLNLSPSLARRLIADPVAAAKVLLDAEFDDFQKVRLRGMWFVPEYMDHSGISSGKTYIVAAWAILRILLLPLHMIGENRVVLIYYLSLGTAQRAFLPVFEKYLSRSKILKNEIKWQNGRKFQKNAMNMFLIEFRNGGRIEIPAGDFINNSDNNASTRANDLVLDEIMKIDGKGDGVDEQLKTRTTQGSFNPNHPVHCNHTVYLGHAESTSHPSYKRYAAMRREYRRQGSQDCATITSSYKDFTGEYYERLGQPVEKLHEASLRKNDPSVSANIYDGLWGSATRGLYLSTMRDRIQTISAPVLLGRKKPETLFALGWDSAAGMSVGSDFNWGTVWAAEEVRFIPSSQEPGYLRLGNKLWYVWACYTIPGLGWDVDARSGLIHRLDRAFGFDIIVLDGLGGGSDVYKKVRQRRQFIDNRWVDVLSGICTPGEAHAWPGSRPILHFYDRKDPHFRDELGERYLRDQTGPLHYMHQEVKGMMRAGEIAWPAPWEQRGAEERSRLTQDEADVLQDMEATLRQYGNIAIALTKDKKPEISQAGYQKFSKSGGKTDGAMSSNYGLLGLISRLKKISGVGASPVDDTAEVMGVF